MNSSRLCTTSIDSPLGPLRLVATREALVGVYLPGQQPPPPAEAAGAADVRALAELDHPLLAWAARELAAYFRGELTIFTTPIAFGGTTFQRAVWTALLTIPCGERRSYGWLAQNVGRPRAVRAVGSANGRNALSIVVPCHRVVGADGALTGYAGGLEAKRWLLDHEMGSRA